MVSSDGGAWQIFKPEFPLIFPEKTDIFIRVSNATTNAVDAYAQGQFVLIDQTA
jgi:hypothetical protein